MRVLALAGACIILVALTEPTRAQSATGFTPAEIATNSCWIDAATGHRVDTGPYLWTPTGISSSRTQPVQPDANHVSSGGKNYVRVADTGWIDAATGNPVPTGPYLWTPTGISSSRTQPVQPDANHVSSGGKNYVRVPCPPPSPQGQQAQPAQPQPGYPSAGGPPPGDQTMGGPPPGYDQGPSGPPPGYGYDQGGPPPPSGPPVGIGGFGFGFGFGHKP